MTKDEIRFFQSFYDTWSHPCHGCKFSHIVGCKECEMETMYNIFLKEVIGL
jgi:hypothetical protein